MDVLAKRRKRSTFQQVRARPKGNRPMDESRKGNPRMSRHRLWRPGTSLAKCGHTGPAQRAPCPRKPPRGMPIRSSCHRFVLMEPLRDERVFVRTYTTHKVHVPAVVRPRPVERLMSQQTWGTSPPARRTHACVQFASTSHTRRNVHNNPARHAGHHTQYVRRGGD